MQLSSRHPTYSSVSLLTIGLGVYLLIIRVSSWTLFTYNWTLFRSGKTDPIQIKKGFEKGRLRDKIANIRGFFFESPMPEEREAACKKLMFLQAKRPLF